MHNLLHVPGVILDNDRFHLVFMKNLARLGVAFYLLAVFFVVFHNVRYEAIRLLEGRYLVPLLMGVLGAIALLHVIQEATDDEPASGSGKNK